MKHTPHSAFQLQVIFQDNTSVTTKRMIQASPGLYQLLRDIDLMFELQPVSINILYNGDVVDSAHFDNIDDCDAVLKAQGRLHKLYLRTVKIDNKCFLCLPSLETG